MKKIGMLLSLVVLCFSSVTVFAVPQFTYEIVSQNDPRPIFTEINGKELLLFTTRGQDYLMKITKYGFPVKYDADLINAFGGSSEYVWTGSVYMVRYTGMDGLWFDKDYYIRPLQFYDENLNLIYEHKFDQHIMEMGYWQGIYYCRLAARWMMSYSMPEKVLKSADMRNWEETEEEIPHLIGSVAYTKEDQVALDQENLLSINRESDVPKEYCSTLGEWIVKRGEDQNYYFSNDNVYFVKAEYPQALREFNENYRLRYDFNCIYEYQGEIVIEEKVIGSIPDENAWATKKARLRVPTQEIYAELDQQKANAAYVKLNGELLGFDVPPVIEDDRILVPMRFLFEQMGAEVDWDNDTQTATVLQESDEIAFQINNLSANVNSQPQTMDVPARLINDKTMIPLRFLSENLGYTVEWDGVNNMAIITEEPSQ